LQSGIRNSYRFRFSATDQKRRTANGILFDNRIRSIDYPGLGIAMIGRTALLLIIIGNINWETLTISYYVNKTRP
jgi:hypothetical protein